MAFTIQDARAKFQALQDDQVFMDNAGGSQVLDTVTDSISNYLRTNNVQLGATYRVSQLSTSLVAKGYEAAAKYVNANVTDIVLGGSTTQILHNLSVALLDHFKEGDEVVLSQIDHEANIEPWVRMASRCKLTVKWWKGSEGAAPNPVLTAENLKPLLSEKTKFVACTHSSNVLGNTHDIPSISKAIHETCPGALFCVDGVAFAPHAPVDVQALGIDFYAFSWYKVYGPHISILYASPNAQKVLTNMDHYFNMNLPSHQGLESKLGMAASNYELTQSLPKVVEYLHTPGVWEAIANIEEEMQKTIIDWLKKDERITIYGETSGDRTKRAPVISFTVQGRKSQEIVEEVERKSNYGIRWGHFYSHRLITQILGLTEDGVVRISLVHYNTMDEVNGLLKVLGEVLKQ